MLGGASQIVSMIRVKYNGKKRTFNANERAERGGERRAADEAHKVRHGGARRGTPRLDRLEVQRGVRRVAPHGDGSDTPRAYGRGRRRKAARRRKPASPLWARNRGPRGGRPRQRIGVIKRRRDPRRDRGFTPVENKVEIEAKLVPARVG